MHAARDYVISSVQQYHMCHTIALYACCVSSLAHTESQEANLLVCYNQ